MRDQYFADPRQDPEELVRNVCARLDEEARHIGAQSSLFELWRKSFDAFHSALGWDEFSSAHLGRRGSRGQGLTLSTGQSRALATQASALICNAPTTLSAGSSNVDVGAQAAVHIGQVVLDHEWMTQGLESLSTDAVTASVWAGEYFIFAEWDKHLGPPLASDGFQLHRAGGIRYDLVEPWRVIRDSRAGRYDESPWVAVMVRRNRFDLAAKYEEKRADILAAESGASLWRVDRGLSHGDEDGVMLTHFFAKPSPSVPDGLHLVILGETLLEARPYPDALPLARIAPGDLGPWGYTSFWHTLAAADAENDTWSGLLTGMRVFGRPLISAETGSDVSVDSLGDEGAQLLWRSPGASPPVPVQWSQPPPSADKFLTAFQSMQRQAVGLNDFAMGQPPGSQLNAAAISILVAASTTASSGFQKRRVVFLRQLGKIVIALYSANARSPMTVAVVGKNQRGSLEKSITFTGQELRGVDTVNVDVASGLAATSAGRVQLLEILRAQGVEVTGEDVVSVLDTGRLTQPLNRERGTNTLLSYLETEFRAGRPVEPLFSDPPLKVAELCAALQSDPEVRANPAALEAIGAYLAGLMDLIETTDPRILALMGVQLPAPPPPPGDAGGPPPPAEPGAPMDVPLPESTPEQFAAPPFQG